MNNLSEDILMRYLTGECSDTTAFRIRKKLPGQKHDYTRNWLRKMHIAAK